MDTIIKYSKASDPPPPEPEPDIDQHYHDLIRWGSTTMRFDEEDISTCNLTLKLSEEITTEQLEAIFNLVLKNKNKAAGELVGKLLKDQAIKMIEESIKKVAA